MKVFRHAIVGNRNLCGAPRKSMPERYMSSERYLHEVKACPKCKEMVPELKGFDDLLKQQPVVLQQPVVKPAVVHVSTTLYLRDYLTGRDSQ